MSNRGGVITGWGGYLPEGVVTNKDLTERMDTTDEWIVERTGIRERRWGDEPTAITRLKASSPSPVWATSSRSIRTLRRAW